VPVPSPRMSYLVATDGSTESESHPVRRAAGGRVLRDAGDRPRVNARLGAHRWDAHPPGEEAAVEAGEDILSNARRLADDEAVGDESIDIETQLLTGRPADAITGYAREQPVDAIYVGHRGLSEEREQVVGSVAKSVVDKANVPVTVIR